MNAENSTQFTATPKPAAFGSFRAGGGGSGLDLSRLQAVAVEVGAMESTPEFHGRLVQASGWLASTPPPIDGVIDGLFEAGDKVGIFGKSKTRKSFFVLQLAFSLATGKPFLGLTVTRRRRVLLIQLEIKASHMHRRVRTMARSMGVDAVDGLSIFNGRGTGLDKDAICKLATDTRAEVVIIDPLYKLMPSDESAEPMAAIMGIFDAVTERTGAAVCYVHHDKKGQSGDLDLVDRGSGSGIVGRDYDTALFLTPHVDGEAVVLEFITRNHPPRDGAVIRFDDGCFIVDGDATASVETSRTQAARRSRGATLGELADKAAGLLEVGQETQVEAFRSTLQDQFSIGRERARDVVRMLADREGFFIEKTKTFPMTTTIRRLT